MYRVIFPDGRATTPTDSEKIRQMFGEGKIPAGAIIEQHIPIAEFVAPDPLATETQKQVARNLQITFHPQISRRAISTLIEDAEDARQEKKRSEMARVREQDLGDRALLIAEMEGEGQIWLKNATTNEMVDELESRDIATIMISMRPDDVSTLVAIQEEEMTEELASELQQVQSKTQFSRHIEHHELRKVLMSVLVGIPEERKPRRKRRLHD